MSLLSRMLRRGPSDDLQEAQSAHEEILSRREETLEVTNALREDVRLPNNLAPLLENILRSRRK